MRTLSNGYQQPETGDLGGEFFPALEQNIQRTNDHSHDGLNSNRLDSASFVVLTVPVAETDFSLVGDAFEVLVTCPPNILVADSNINLRNPVTKDRIDLPTAIFSINQFRVFANQPIALEAVFA